jgi:formamidopyrimidine-DNA glycosylase
MSIPFYVVKQNYAILAHMPELPEVQTTVDGINLVAKGRKIVSVWTNMFSSAQIYKDITKNKKYFTTVFQPHVQGAKIVSASRRAKNILIQLSNKTTILIHMKMTGHIMYGKYTYDIKTDTWKPKKGQVALEDPFNRFVRMVFTLDNGYHLVLCDMRKFAKVTLVDTHTTKDLAKLGPEPFDVTFDAPYFISHITKYQKRYIKTVLLDQTFVSGIGNIYSDEILHAAHIRPDRTVETLSKKELTKIHAYIAPLLRSGIDMGGDSMSDYRNIHGERGKFQGKHKVYRRTGLVCTSPACKGIVERKLINTRSAHFCSRCQK